MLKKRDQEAFNIFSMINQNSTGENFVDTYLDFEDLKEAKTKDSKNIIVQFMKWKYIGR